MRSALLAMTLLATPAFAQITALPEPVQARIREIGPAMGAAGVNGSGEALAPVMPPNTPPTQRDAQYGPDARNRLDVWAASATGAPVLVFVHGGGFVGGDKTRPGVHFYDNIASWAVRNGMAAVNITYRLAPGHTYPAVIEDITAALTWVRANITAHGGDPARIILMGQSAGAAHVADYLARNAASPGVAAAVLVSGVYDAASYPPGPTASAYYGGDPAVLAQRSALPGLSRLRIPVLLANAALEPQPFRDQGALLRARLPTARFLDLAGHNHFSPVFGLGSADAELSNAILALRTTP